MEIPKIQPQFAAQDNGVNSAAELRSLQQTNPDSQIGTLVNAMNLNPALQVQGFVQPGAIASPRSMADAAIRGVVSFMNSVTTIFAEPPKPPAPPVTRQIQPPPAQPQPFQQPTPVETPPAQSAPPATQAAQQSLIPPWARIFESTGNSEWRPGGASQKAYIDLRRELKGKIQSLELLSPDGMSVIATGTLERVGDDGRPRFRFNKTGKDIPAGAYIKATLAPNKDGGAGGIRYIEIPNPERKFVW